jgi:hypothetical protein
MKVVHTLMRFTTTENETGVSLSHSDAVPDEFKQERKLMNSRGLTIKISTNKVIQILEDKLATKQQEYADYPAQQEKYDAQVKAWEKKCLSIALKNVSKSLESSVQDDWSARDGRTRLSIWYDKDLFPEKPKKPDAVNFGRYSISNDVTDLQDVIRMLKLHESDTISTATYKSVSRWL